MGPCIASGLGHRDLTLKFQPEMQLLVFMSRGRLTWLSSTAGDKRICPASVTCLIIDLCYHNLLGNLLTIGIVTQCIITAVPSKLKS